MLMKDPKKQMATVIVAKLKDKKEHSEMEAPMDMDPKQIAAEELLAAIESKSPEQLVAAFQSLMSMCEQSEPEEESESLELED